MLPILMTLRAFIQTIPKVVWGVLAAIVVIVALMLWSAHQGAAREHERIALATAAANAAAAKRDQASRDLAAEERVVDQKSVDQEKEDLDNAVSHLPDASPTEREFALACQRLRRQSNGDQAAAAAGCRPQG